MLSDGNEAEAAAARLETALERIAALAGRPGAAVATPADPASLDVAAVDVAVVAGRLDALIAELREALAG